MLNMIFTNIINTISEINEASIVVGFISLLFLFTNKVSASRGYFKKVPLYDKGLSKEKDPVLFAKAVRDSYLLWCSLLVFAILLEIVIRFYK